MTKPKTDAAPAAPPPFVPVTVTVLPKALKAAACCTADDAGRFALHRVRVRPDGTLDATDGRILCTIGHPHAEENQPAAGALPILADLDAVRPVVDAIGRLKKHTRESIARTVLEHAAVRSLPPTVAAESAPCDGSFPPLDQIVPPFSEPSDALGGEHRRISAVVTLGEEPLRKMLDAMKALGVTAVRLQLPPVKERGGNTYQQPGTVQGAVRGDALTPEGAPVLFVLAPCSTVDTKPQKDIDKARAEQAEKDKKDKEAKDAADRKAREEKREADYRAECDARAGKP